MDGIETLSSEHASIIQNQGATSDKLNDLGDSFKEGLNEIKEQILKTEVTALPKQFLNTLNTLADTVNGIVKPEDLKTLLPESKELEPLFKSGPNQWSDSTVAKLPMVFAGPALMLNNSIKSFLDENSPLLQTLNNLSSSVVKMAGHGAETKDAALKNVSSAIIIGGNISDPQEYAEGIVNLSNTLSKIKPLNAETIKSVTTDLNGLLKSIPDNKDLPSQATLANYKGSLEGVNEIFKSFPKNKDLPKNVDKVEVSLDESLAAIKHFPKASDLPSIKDVFLVKLSSFYFKPALQAVMDIFKDLNIPKNTVQLAKKATKTIESAVSTFTAMKSIVKSMPFVLTAGLIFKSDKASKFIQNVIRNVCNIFTDKETGQSIISPVAKEHAKEAEDAIGPIAKALGGVKNIVKGLTAMVLATPLFIMATPTVKLFAKAVSSFVDNFSSIDKRKINSAEEKITSLQKTFKTLVKTTIFAAALSATAVMGTVGAMLATLFIKATAKLLDNSSFKSLVKTDLNEVNETMKNLAIMYSYMIVASLAATVAGTFAISGSLGDMALILFAKATSLFLNKGIGTIDFGKVMESKATAIALAGLFISMAIATMAATVAGVFAIPGTLGLILMVPFLLVFKLVSKLFTQLTGQLGQMILACTLMMIAAIEMKVAIMLISSITLKDIGKSLLALIGVTVILAAMAGLGYLATYVIPLIAAFTAAVALMAVSMIMVAITIKMVMKVNSMINQLTESSDGSMAGKLAAIGGAIVNLALALLPIIALMIGFTILGIIAQITVPFILAGTVALALCAVSVNLVPVILKGIDKINNTMSLSKGGDGDKNDGGLFGSIFKLIGILLPIGLLMLAFTVVGLIGWIASVAMLGFLLFCVESLGAFKLLSEMMKAMSQCIEEIFPFNKPDTEKSSGVGGILEFIGGALKGIGAVLKFIGSIIGIILIVASIALLGVICTAAAPVAGGMVLFAKAAESGLGSLGGAVTAMQGCIDSIFDVGEPDEEKASGAGGLLGFLDGALAGIGTVLKYLGKMIGLIVIVASIAVLGAVATAATPLMMGLPAFASMAKEGMENLADAFTAIPKIIDTAQTIATKAKANNAAEEGWSLKDLWTGVKSVFVGNTAAEASTCFDSAKMVILSLASLGATVGVASGGLKSLKNTAKDLDDGVEAISHAFETINKLPLVKANGQLVADAITNGIIDPIAKIDTKETHSKLKSVSNDIRDLNDSLNLLRKQNGKTLDSLFGSGSDSVMSINTNTALGGAQQQVTVIANLSAEDTDLFNQITEALNAIKNHLCKTADSWKAKRVTTRGTI